MSHPVLSPGHVALVTGAACGIGLEACKRFASLGMKTCLADVAGSELDYARGAVAEAAPGGADDIIAVVADVGELEDLHALKTRVEGDLGPVDLLMNNAVIRDTAGPWEDLDIWRHALEVNFFGVLNGVQVFVPDMLARGAPGLVVNTGSKQGITSPPGKPPYNVAKSALKTYTELLQHEFRSTEGCELMAHLLIPGMTTTGKNEHKPGAWWPSQVVDMLIEAINHGSFYILCPDGEVTPEMDRKRILWGAGDITENRPPLSRWHGGYGEAFEAFEP